MGSRTYERLAPVRLGLATMLWGVGIPQSCLPARGSETRRENREKWDVVGMRPITELVQRFWGVEERAKYPNRAGGLSWKFEHGRLSAMLASSAQFQTRTTGFPAKGLREPEAFVGQRFYILGPRRYPLPP